MRDIYKECRGSYTIEAVLIMSTLILVLSLMILSFMLIYHQVLLNKTAAQAAQQAAAAWVRGGTGEGLYYRLLNDSIMGEHFHSSQAVVSQDLKSQAPGIQVQVGDRILDEKFAAIERTVFAGLVRTIKKPRLTQVDVRYKNRILSRQLKVTVSQEMKIPFGQLKRFFDGKETITLTSSAVAEVTEPAEFIRNID